MVKVMKEYAINYIKAFDNYNPDDAYDIVLSIFKQHGRLISAGLLVRAILDGYNWINIVDRRHEEFKKLSKSLM